MYLGFTPVIREFEICPPFPTGLSSPPTSLFKVRNVSAPQHLSSPLAIPTRCRLAWQHTGLGVPSRLATHILPTLTSAASPPPTPMQTKPMSHRHYASKSLCSILNGARLLETDQAEYIKQCYGRNLGIVAAKEAKHVLRIVGVLVHDGNAINGDVEVAQSIWGVDVTEDNVSLHLVRSSTFALGCIHVNYVIELVTELSCLASLTSMLSRSWGPGYYYFLGHGLDSSIDELETILGSETAQNPHESPILALITEFPSYPLLRLPDLSRLQTLADKYDFLIIVDDSISNFVMGILQALTPPKQANTTTCGKGRKRKCGDEGRGAQAQVANNDDDDGLAPVHVPIFPKLMFLLLEVLDFSDEVPDSGVLYDLVMGAVQRRKTNKTPVTTATTGSAAGSRMLAV